MFVRVCVYVEPTAWKKCKLTNWLVWAGEWEKKININQTNVWERGEKKQSQMHMLIFRVFLSVSVWEKIDFLPFTIIIVVIVIVMCVCVIFLLLVPYDLNASAAFRTRFRCACDTFSAFISPTRQLPYNSTGRHFSWPFFLSFSYYTWNKTSGIQEKNFFVCSVQIYLAIIIATNFLV